MVSWPPMSSPVRVAGYSMILAYGFRPFFLLADLDATDFTAT